MGENFPGGNFPRGNFPRTICRINIKKKVLENAGFFSMNCDSHCALYY